MRSYTFSELGSKGYSFSDMDTIIAQNLGTFCIRRGKSCLTTDLDTVEAYFEEVNKYRGR